MACNMAWFTHQPCKVGVWQAGTGSVCWRAHAREGPTEGQAACEHAGRPPSAPFRCRAVAFQLRVRKRHRPSCCPLPDERLAWATSATLQPSIQQLQWGPAEAKRSACPDTQRGCCMHENRREGKSSMAAAAGGVATAHLAMLLVLQQPAPP